MARVEGGQGFEHASFSEESASPLVENLGARLDPVLWPETAGIPPIRGGSGEEDDETEFRRVAEVAEQTELSAGRIRALLKEGKLEGEMREMPGRGSKEKWVTSVAAVKKYKENLPTPEEYGQKGGLIGGRIAGRGRPKKVE